MNEHPLSNTFDKVMKDLQGGVDAAMIHLQQGMQEYLTNTIDLPKLLKMVEKMGILNIMGVARAPSMPGFDAYKILGLDKTATDDEVKKRYSDLLHKLHPDIAGVKGTEFLTQIVITAYGMIKQEREWK